MNWSSHPRTTPRRGSLLRVAALLLAVFPVAVAAAQDAESVQTKSRQKAFPTAEGFGQYARGGRDGQVIYVTNLNDSGPGSLREAVQTKGPRTILFKVSGNIELESGLQIREPFVTIAGQTAPGDGICITNYELYVRTHDAIIRHIRVRPSATREGERDAITLRSATDTIIDHCSASWGLDEVLSTTFGENVTVQWCLITEALHDAGHHKGDHGFGGLIQGDGISYHHNYYAHSRSRNPRPASGLIDFRNNVIYNWDGEAGYAGTINKQRLNYISNYLKPGPSTERHRYVAFHTGGPDTYVYFDSNVLEGAVPEGGDNRAIINVRTHGNLVNEPFDVIEPETHLATEAMELVLEQAGATLPKRDAVDARVISDFRNTTGSHIDTIDEVGGWPELRSTEPPADTDVDGMPNTWERSHGLDPDNPSDGNGDQDDDGYTNLEEYLNGTDPTVKD